MHFTIERLHDEEYGDCGVAYAGYKIGDALADAVLSDSMNKRHTPEQEALSDLVKESGKKGVSNADADTLLDWSEEYHFPARDDRGKPPHWIGGEHIHIGPRHVPVYD